MSLLSRSVRLAAALALLPIAVQAAPAKTLGPKPVAPKIVILKSVPLTVASAGGIVRFRVELAATPAQQERGLMYRRAMPRTGGMIFPMDPPRPASFWMKNTYLPLDIIFIGPDRRILQISRGNPLSEAIVDCPVLVGAVLELNAGTAARLGIREGDKVSW